MGGGFIHGGPAEALHQLNLRFAPGKPLEEMVTIQKEARVFTPERTLQQAYRLLHIVPSNHSDRDTFYKLLDRLKKCPSDIDGMNGHDRIMKARQDNLEGSEPLPTYSTTHLAATDKRVTVTRGQPISHDSQEYLIISIPTIPWPPATSGPAAAGRKRAARKKSAG